MREGWEVKRLGDVCNIIGGGTPSKSNNEYYTGDILWATVRDMKKEILDNTELRITNEAVNNSSTNIIPKNKVIIATRVGLGKVCMLSFDTAINQDLKGIIVKEHYNILDKFIFWWFKSIGKHIVDQGTGLTVQGVKLEFIKSLEFPYLRLEEQTQIVATLDKTFKQIDQAKENLEKNLHNAKELFQSKLNEVFSQRGEGWEEKRLGEIASVEYGFTAKSTVEGTFRYIRITDIDTKGNLISNEKKYIEDYEEARKFQLKENDILMARTGATFGKVLLYKDYEPSVFASYLIRIHFIENIYNELYWYFSKSQYYWSQANKLSSGSAQPHFNGKALKEVIFSYPKSMKEQEKLILEFKSLLDEVENLQTHYQQKLNNLEELKKSILQKAFRGEL